MQRVAYRPVEIEARRLEEFRQRLSAAGHAERLATDDGAAITGLVVANEVLDALPTHRVVWRGGEEPAGDLRGLARRRFADVRPAVDAGPRGAPRRRGIVLRPGQRAEVCLAVDDWVASAAAGLERGVTLFIDYGYPAAELYDPVRRPRGTLAAYLGQRAHEDPYRAVGRQDLTAHVDTTAVERAAATAGLDHLATTTQARSWLVSGRATCSSSSNRARRHPPALPRREGGPRPDDRPGGDGQVPGPRLRAWTGRRHVLRGLV